MHIKATLKSIFNFLTFRSTGLTVQASLLSYYEEYAYFVQDQSAMHDVISRLDNNSPIELIIKAHGDAKTFQQKAIEHIKTCMTLAPSPEEKERLILELDSIRSHQAA
ncbi:MAG: hypothetical protein JKY54_11210 [Flavobacteriales bacterium]|nr:hypothetical protein [Flavobacteriales bacterium]